jgi:hypothetical protein
MVYPQRLGQVLDLEMGPPPLKRLTELSYPIKMGLNEQALKTNGFL